MLFSPSFRLILVLYKLRAVCCLKIVMILFCLITIVNTRPAYADNNNTSPNTAIKNISLPVFTTETNKKTDDVIEDLLIIIGEQNFRLNQHADIGKAIARRNNISFPDATVLHFCNLTYARQLLEIAPDYLLRMPCRIAVWAKNDSSTIIEVWLLPENDKRTLEIAKIINAILIKIVTFGAT